MTPAVLDLVYVASLAVGWPNYDYFKVNQAL